MATDVEPGLYFAGVWGALPEPVRGLITGTQDGDDDRGRAEAWRALIAGDDILPLALAVDVYLQGRAASRMGRPAPLDLDLVRPAALRLLGEPARDATSRFGDRTAKATHVVALRVLRTVATADDLALLLPLAPLAATDDDPGSEWADAWLWASTGVLVRVHDERADVLVHELARIAREDRFENSVRAAAVRALGTATCPAAERAVHEVMRTALGDLHVEAAAALGARDAWSPDEVDVVRALLANPPNTGTFLVRREDLQAAVDRATRR
ncbi:MAG TPA: hypothetical protein VGO00_14735 [Kofleriaceae bacterium]|nr:hypothetical protein [Kofleriaceae bacterium]